MIENDLFDDVLNLEESFYKNGLKEGEKNGEKAGIAEGRQVGVDSAFRRYFLMGVINGRTSVWKQTIQKTTNLSSDGTISDSLTHLQNNKLSKTVNNLQKLTTNVPYTNSDADVKEFSKRLATAKQKAKLIQNLLNDQVKLEMPHYVKELKTVNDGITIEQQV